MANVCAGGRLCGLCVPQDPPMDEILLRTEISRHTPMCAEKWPNHAAHRGAGRRSGAAVGAAVSAAVGGGGRGDGGGTAGGRQSGGTVGAVVGADVPGGPPPARVRPRQARPSRVAYAGFHFGTVAVVGADVLGGPPPARVRPRQARPSRVAGPAATSAALPCGVRGISLRNGRGGRVATYRRAKAPRQGSAGPSSAGLRFVRWSSVRPLAFGRRARTRSKRGCRPRRTARPCRSRSRRPSP